MPQYQSQTCFEGHGENGLKFISIIVDKGLLDKKLGFPISAVNDEKAYRLYKSVIEMKRVIRYRFNTKQPIGQECSQTYLCAKHIYLDYIKQYHVP
jgi:hypothetical protein